MGTKPREERMHLKQKTPTFLLELPLMVEAGQAARLGISHAGYAICNKGYDCETE
jgi:hypothetical protein